MDGNQVKKTVTAALFTPASPVEAEDLERGASILERECPIIQLSPPPARSGNAPFPYLAARDDDQANIFLDLVAGAADLLWAARGGYGSMRWLPQVLSRLPSRPPTVVGFSDITFLHSLMLNNGGTTIHGPMLATLPDTSKESRQALFQAMTSGRFPALRGELLVDGAGRGRLIGGNLTCICHSIGTPLEPPWEGSILLIEDHNEPLYRIDRMLTHLLLTGRLDRLNGIAVGSLHKDAQQAKEIVADRLGAIGIPIIYGLPVGHGPDNMPLNLGRDYSISGDLLTPE